MTQETPGLTDGSVAAPRADFGFMLGRLARWWRSQIDERMRPLGLTQARWIVLVHLRRGGDGLTQKELARFVGVEGPTLVRTLDYLESEGLIERREDATDRRAKTVHLSDAGRTTLTEIVGLGADLRENLLLGVSDAEIAVCLGVFERIRSNGEALQRQAREAAE